MAQNAPSLDGSWVAKFPAPNGALREAKIVIANGSGTYQVNAKSREDPCIGREFPVLVSNVSAEGFDLTINASKALPGCADVTWRPKASENGSYAGAFPDGRKYVLVRQ